MKNMRVDHRRFDIAMPPTTPGRFFADRQAYGHIHGFKVYPADALGHRLD